MSRPVDYAGMRTIATGGQRFWLDEEGIIHVELEPHVDIGAAEAEASIRAVASLGGGVRRPVVIDFRGIRSMNRDARQYYAGPKTAEVVPAAALIVESPLGKAIGNFMMGLNKPLSPTRIFNAEPEALAWLRAFV